ncbi:MAG TPA: diacylglycerol kinase family protein [Motilibacteraceae bacterium]|nr:diacylglycerol kinase family protein [Motilibacteraceae bacterium]
MTQEGSVPPAARDLLVVTNAAAGGAQDDAVQAALEVLRAGARVRVEATAGPAEVETVVASRAPGERVVVVGGDGSVHTVVEALDRLGGLSPSDPVGVVPLGTGNDLARCLGLPLEPEQAARVVLTGRPRPLDVLVDDDGGLVVNAVHAGVGASAAEAAQAWKERLGAAGYAVGSALAGVREAGWRLRVLVDGRELAAGSTGADDRLLMVGLGIGRSIGGGALLAPDAEPDDGLVDVVLVGATGPLARVGYAVALRAGDHVERDDVEALRGREVVLTAAGPGEEFGTNADGELAGPFTRRRWTVRPAAWSCLVP